MLIRINSVAMSGDYERIHQAIENGMQPVPTHLWTLTKDYLISRPDTLLDNSKLILDSFVQEGQNISDTIGWYKSEIILHAVQFVMDFICLLFV